MAKRNTQAKQARAGRLTGRFRVLWAIVGLILLLLLFAIFTTNLEGASPAKTPSFTEAPARSAADAAPTAAPSPAPTKAALRPSMSAPAAIMTTTPTGIVAPTSMPNSLDQSAQVTRVIDGDTIIAAFLVANTPDGVPVARDLPALPQPVQAELPTARPAPELLPVQVLCECRRNLYNWGDLGTYSRAQACFGYCRHMGHGDMHQLDRDNDWRACESLP